MGQGSAGHTLEQIAQELHVDKATVLRTVALFKSTGQVSKRPYPADKAFRKLTDPAHFLVLHMVFIKPGITLREIQMNYKIRYF